MTDLSSLRRRLADCAARSPRLARQLEGVDLAALKRRPTLRRSRCCENRDLAHFQREAPAVSPGIARGRAPRSNACSCRPVRSSRARITATTLMAPSSPSPPPASAGDIVLNCFSYHLTPGGFIMESGAHALGCAVIPAGTGNTEQTLQAIAHLKPTAYVGPPDFLKILLDKARRVDISSIRKALVSGGALPPSLRAEFEARGVRTRQAYATAELGVIAYETDGAGRRARAGLAGQRRRPSRDRARRVRAIRSRRAPSARSWSRRCAAASRCCVSPPATSPPFSATTRIRGWMGRADQTTKVKGLFVHPSAVVETAKRHPELSAVRLVVRREGEQDFDDPHRRDRDGRRDALARSRRGDACRRRRSCAARLEFVAAGFAAERRQDDRRRAAGGLGPETDRLPGVIADRIVAVGV